MTLTINREKISEKTISFGKTHLIELHKYYDLDGDKINEGIDTFNSGDGFDFDSFDPFGETLDTADAKDADE